MKVFILANPDSVHTRKWVTSLCERGIAVVLFGLNEFDTTSYIDLANFKSYSAGFSSSLSSRDSKFSKLRYLTVVKKIRKAIKTERPDILHAHYATSYGLMGALSKFHPYIISVWGSDVFDFPLISIFHRKLVEYNLRKADKVLSTSYIMAKETEKYTDKQIEVTPFGIDLNIFKHYKSKSEFDDHAIVIGTIKNLASKYGIDYLIKAFKIISDKYPYLNLKLLIVGGGTKERALYLKKLVKELSIDEKVIFTGFVPHEEVPKYYNMLDIYVAVSILDSESFGVAVLEASACEKPVVAANIGGLPEVVRNGETGYLVEPKNEYETAHAIERLILNKELRYNMGKNGRKHVEEKFNWPVCVDKMIGIYNNIVKSQH